MSEPDSSAYYCSQLARQAAEPVYGTALHAEVWFLLEVNQPWSAKATADNKLPRPVQAWLHAQVAAGPGRRLQFIRQGRAGRQTGLAFFIALASEEAPAVYRFTLPDYQSLPQLDVEAVIRRDPACQGNLHPDPLYLICTNGKRDRCCAQFGADFYRTMSAKAGAAVWQTTHLGGHRFAATALQFPHGIGYGHLQPEDSDALLAAQRQGALLLERMRGRLCYPPLIQTAAYYLHRYSGDLRADAFRHIAAHDRGQGRWEVDFLGPGGSRHRVALAQSDHPLQTVPSCGSAVEKPRIYFRFLGVSAG